MNVMPKLAMIPKCAYCPKHHHRGSKAGRLCARSSQRREAKTLWKAKLIELSAHAAKMEGRTLGSISQAELDEWRTKHSDLMREALELAQRLEEFD